MEQPHETGETADYRLHSAPPRTWTAEDIMTRILIVYGTTDGHTAKVAGAIADALRAGGAVVDVHQIGRAHCLPDGYDGVIVASPLRGGKYLKPVRRWVHAHAAVLNVRSTVFVSICLGVLQHDPAVNRALNAIVVRFLAETGWRPTVTKLVAGALPYTRYNWFIRRVMKRIAAQAGGDTDTTRDYEYTDWPDLRGFADQVGRLVARHATVSAPVSVSM
jgi:menaquinone-dependent protoporphyrinogen oxidase